MSAVLRAHKDDAMETWPAPIALQVMDQVPDLWMAGGRGLQAAWHDCPNSIHHKLTRKHTSVHRSYPFRTAGGWAVNAGSAAAVGGILGFGENWLFAAGFQKCPVVKHLAAKLRRTVCASWHAGGSCSNTSENLQRELCPRNVRYSRQDDSTARAAWCTLN